MTFANLGFETAGATAGSAANWTLNVVATGVSLAVYDTSSANPLLTSTQEGFEGYWSSNSSYVFAFSDPVAQLSSAIYATDLPSTKFVEDFDEKWTVNEAYVTSITLAEAAPYNALPLYLGPVNIEEFDGGWLGGDFFYTDVDGISGPAPAAASYDSTPEAFEDFEEDWTAGFVTDIGAGSAASYDSTPEAFEDYEEDWPTLVMTTV